MEERREKEELAGKLLQADRQKKEEMKRRQEMESSDVKLEELKRMKDSEGCMKGADTADKNSRLLFKFRVFKQSWSLVN